MSDGLISLYDIGHCQWASRWHTTDHNGEQSLASHSFNVTMFAVAIARKVMGERFSETDELNLMRYGLNHDVAELVTGDQPSPYKRALRRKMPQFDEVMESIEVEIYPIAAEYKQKIKRLTAYHYRQTRRFIRCKAFHPNKRPGYPTKQAHCGKAQCQHGGKD